MVLSSILILIFLTIVLSANLVLRFKSKLVWLFSVLLIFVVPFAIFTLSYNISTISTQSLDQNSFIDSSIVVLGAGIKNDIPTEILKRRLETAQQVYNQTKQKIIVTGDNSKQYHNEPKVMKNYLIKLGVQPSDIIEDFGGRRTMDSCYRIKNYFGVSKIIIISQAFHLPRAKFLCESLGLQVQTKRARDISYSTTVWGYLREFPASWAALWDSIYFQPQVGSDGSEKIE